MGYIVLAFLGICLLVSVFHTNYRNRIPSARHLFENNVRRRHYAFRKASELYVGGEKIPWFEKPFVQLDISELEKEGRLGYSTVYFKEKKPVEETLAFKEEFARFLARKDVAWKKTQGHPERCAKLLQDSPFDYYEEVFFEKTLSNARTNIRREISF